MPILSVPQLIENAAKEGHENPDFAHPFYQKVAEYVNAGDMDAINRERIPLKLLRLTPAAQEGFVLVDYPYELPQAEVMEEFKGGLNAFVHISLPDEILVDIEETKVVCQDCGKHYYKDDVVSEEHGVRIERHIPDDGYCFSCGSTNLAPGSDPLRFERELEVYASKKDDLLAFYNEYGLLVDFEPRGGYDDYDKLKRQIQYKIKH